MQKNYYIYNKPECKVIINKIPIWFKETLYEGDQDKGSIIFETHDQYDEIYKSIARIELSFYKKDRIKFLHAREVQESIDLYNAISVVVTEKENSWLNSHEFTYWFGHRTKMIRKRYYPENHVHGLFYCELTNRLFEMHSIIIRDHYEGFKPYILAAFNSVVCH
ncbi:MAG: hypothetical protein EU539_02930 [Promethearchaeota archaeon]|nr:MAG: hypothetical protein EU539_02930 [Candidatus Lokiarchaeota archaeon]